MPTEKPLDPRQINRVRQSLANALVAVVEARAVFHDAGNPSGERPLNLPHVEHLIGGALTESAKL